MVGVLAATATNYTFGIAQFGAAMLATVAATVVTYPLVKTCLTGLQQITASYIYLVLYGTMSGGNIQAARYFMANYTLDGTWSALYNEPLITSAPNTFSVTETNSSSAVIKMLFTTALGSNTQFSLNIYGNNQYGNSSLNMDPTVSAGY